MILLIYLHHSKYPSIVFASYQTFAVPPFLTATFENNSAAGCISVVLSDIVLALSHQETLLGCRPYVQHATLIRIWQEGSVPYQISLWIKLTCLRVTDQRDSRGLESIHSLPRPYNGFAMAFPCILGSTRMWREELCLSGESCFEGCQCLFNTCIPQCYLSQEYLIPVIFHSFQIFVYLHPYIFLLSNSLW